MASAAAFMERTLDRRSMGTGRALRAATCRANRRNLYRGAPRRTRFFPNRRPHRGGKPAAVGRVGQTLAAGLPNRCQTNRRGGFKQPQTATAFIRHTVGRTNPERQFGQSVPLRSGVLRLRQTQRAATCGFFVGTPDILRRHAV